MHIKILIKAVVYMLFATVCTPKVWADSISEVVDNSSASEGLRLSTAAQYFKPVNPSAPRSPSTTTGTRTGGCLNSDVSPALMAPTNFVGETASDIPTLTWVFPVEAPVPVELHLYALQPSGVLELHHSSALAYEPGLSQYSLPAESALDANQNYLWQMVLHCNPNRPSQSLVYEAEIEFVPGTVDVQAVGSAVEQSRVLAEAGYWYDAIAVLGTSETSEIAQFRSVLLNDLALLEEAIDKDVLEE